MATEKEEVLRPDLVDLEQLGKTEPWPLVGVSGPRPAGPPRPSRPGGQGVPVDLAVGVSGSSSSQTYREGTMTGKEAAQELVQLVGCGRSLPEATT